MARSQRLVKPIIQTTKKKILEKKIVCKAKDDYRITLIQSSKNKSPRTDAYEQYSSIEALFYAPLFSFEKAKTFQKFFVVRESRFQGLCVASQNLEACPIPTQRLHNYYLLKIAPLSRVEQVRCGMTFEIGCYYATRM